MSGVERIADLKTRLHLVRHGESTHNAEGRIQGHSDTALSELGLRQGQAVAAALAELPIDAIYSSPLRRAWQTAEAIAAPHGKPVMADRRLMELHVGLFQDRLRSELLEECPVEFAQWLSGDEDYVIPGGESRLQLLDRATEAIREIAARGQREVVVVSHGGLLSVLLRHLLDWPEPLPPFSFKNGSITRVGVDANGRFAMLALSETAHLEKAGISLGLDL